MRLGLHAVGEPGLIAMLTGGALFFFLVVRTGLRTAGAEPATHARRSGVSRLGIGLQMAGFAVCGFGPVRVGLPAGSAAAVAEAAAVALLVAGAVGLFWAATKAMGANWSLAARMREGHELVSHGIFARLRHPIYTGMALFLLALPIALGHEAHLVLGLPLFAVGTWLRVREEERMLRATFGAGYDAYAGRVRRFVPGLI
jgi:protein-S-isoprenylcysteine O-methyltransferase Ste14